LNILVAARIPFDVFDNGMVTKSEGVRSLLRKGLNVTKKEKDVE